MKPTTTMVLGATAAVLILAGSAQAQLVIGKDSAKCRSGFQKNMAKIVKTVQKGIGGCFKNDLKAGGTGSICYDQANYDAKGKLPKAQAKLVDSAAKCKNSATYEGEMLALYSNTCPSPGTPGPLATLSDLAGCLGSIAENHTVNTYRDIFREATQTGLGKDAQKCSGTLFKSVAKIVDGALKESAKCQATIEKGLAKNPGSFYPGYSCFGNYAKLAKSEQKLRDALPDGTKPKCQEGDLEQLGVAGASNFKSVIGDSAQTLAALPQVRVGHVRNLYEGLGQLGWEGGQCPVSAQVRLVPGFQAACSDDGAPCVQDSDCSGIGAICTRPGRVAGTRLDTGFKGTGHGFDLPGDFLGHVTLDCSGATDCSACVISVDPQFEGNRCDNDNTAFCDEPFALDADDCGGALCQPRFSAPLPLSSANTPVCVDNILDSVTGVANAGTGESTTTVTQRSVVYTGLTQTSPCSQCLGDPTSNDGSRDGVCSGGPDNGDPCDASSTSGTFGFGSTSYDCRPGGSNVSGAGLALTLTLTTGTDTLSDTSTTGDAACGPGNVLDCHCATCSGDATVACNTDADCAAVAAGVCDSDGTGVARFPNDCDGDGFSCTDTGDGLLGECASKTSSFCDGALHASGRGYLSCDTDADCDTLDPDCGGDCGNCTITENRACFLPDIVVAGNPSQQQTTVAANFCVPGLGAAGASVNTAAGLAGPGRVAIDFEINAFCDSPGTKQFIGNGGNCNR